MTAFGLYQHQPISCPSSVTGDAGIFFLTLINTLFANQCELGSKDDYPVDAGAALVDNDVFDFIIIGAGTSGSTVASKLASNSTNKVLLLEAGGYPSPTSDIPAFHLSLQETIEDWQFHTEKSNNSCLGFKNGRCLIPSGRVLGGSSTINSMLYTRGGKHVYNAWLEEGNIGWAYQDVSPYFKKSEKLEAHELLTAKLYGTEGLLPLTRNRLHQPIRNTILDSAKELGYKVYNHETQIGFFEALQTIKKGVRQNAAKVFLGEYKSLPNLKVATEALVEKIIIDKDLKEANGVKVNIGDRTISLYAEKEVIVSAGAINSPKLLMLSGIGPREHLGSLGIDTIHDIKVGNNLKDHFMYPIFAVKVNESAMKYLSLNPTEELYRYFANREGILSTTGLNNLIGLVSTKNHSMDPNIKLGYTIIPRQDAFILTQYKRIFNLEEATFKSLADANKNSHLLLVHITLLDAKSRGQVMLKTKSPHDKPIVDPGYLSEEVDVEVLLQGIRIVEKQIETTSFRKLSAKQVHVDIPNCRKHKFKTDDYWKCAIRNVGTTGYHLVGTCKMGLSIDPHSVVDPLLKVHGVGKLRVVDTSVIPTNTYGELAAAAMMVGQKGAQLIMNGFDAIKHFRF
ncbi:glucose dehydrogenase [FAD, quinone]-like [Coccinella septempunctata]|uniref:glucose dehydrogenase [FAD, quinone]-like n=1 Tax=Coccinella septempunctata TaxID=41139 RepID=UPI001D076084|nr:glucose dehydrogenase [FAD, quinone]-like [Coccinella septempunctata]